MALMSLHIDRAVRTGRAQILASTTTDTFLLIDNRLLKRLRIVLVDGDHLDRLRRAMAFAVTAFHAISQRNTILMDRNGMTNLDSRLVGPSNQLNSASRTNLGTFHAFGTAITTLVRHLRLHEVLQFSGRTEHAVRTGGDTKLTSGTMLGEITNTE